MSGKKLTLVILFILVTLSLFLQPAHFLEPDEWAYYYSAENFRRGQFKISEEAYARLQAEAREKAREIGGSHFTQYRKMPDGTRVTEKPPGYVLLLAFFTLLGTPLLLNTISAALALAVVYSFCSRAFDEKTAFLASLFFLFTPISLIFYYRVFLADFAAGCFLTTGILLCLMPFFEEKNGRASPYHRYFLLGGIALGFCLLMRFFNFIPILPLACMLAVRWIRAGRQKTKVSVLKEILAFMPGCFLFLFILLLYNHFMFGSPWTMGYTAGPTPTKWSGQGYAFQLVLSEGKITEAFLICLRNLVTYPQGFLTAFPILLFALPALLTPGKHMPRWIYFVFAGWVILIFGLFMQVIPTNMKYYLLWTRQYLQSLGAIAVLAAVFLRPLPEKAGRWAGAVVAVIGIASLLFYLCKIGVDPFGIGLLELMDRYPGTWAGQGVFGSR